jgi:hypothetical protein
MSIIQKDIQTQLDDNQSIAIETWLRIDLISVDWYTQTKFAKTIWFGRSNSVFLRNNKNSTSRTYEESWLFSALNKMDKFYYNTDFIHSYIIFHSYVSQQRQWTSKILRLFLRKLQDTCNGYNS